MTNSIAQAVGQGDEFYVVVNVGKEWTNRSNMTIAESSSIVYHRIYEAISDNVCDNDISISVVYEEGGKNSPHFNIYMRWDGKAGEVYQIVSTCLGDDGSITDIKCTILMD